MAFSPKGRLMAKIIYPKGTPCMELSPEKIMTDDDRGISFEPSKPDPDGFQQLERMVIHVTMFDFNCGDPWRIEQNITIVQAKEIGKWLCKRARENQRAEAWQKVKSWLKGFTL
jgi:hypothetical protein